MGYDQYGEHDGYGGTGEPGGYPGQQGQPEFPEYREQHDPQYGNREQYGSPYEQGSQYEQYEQYERPAQYEQYGQYGEQPAAPEPQYATPEPQYEYQHQPQAQGYQDAQWAQSGLGWEQRAWDDARLGMSPLQEYSEYESRGERGPGTEYESYDEGYGQSPAFPHQRAEDDAAYYEADCAAPVAPERAPFDHAATEHAPYEQASFEPAAFEQAPVERASARHEQAAGRAGQADQSRKQADEAAVEPQAPGGGAFGAAGVAIVTAVAALASSGALLVVIALVQVAVAYGWQQAVGVRSGGKASMRAVVLTAFAGFAATAAVSRLSLDSALMAIPATLGIGYVLLAADQTLRKGGTGGDAERVAGLAVTVTGLAFTVLPAGLALAERQDSALTAASASAAALGVLCYALLGRSPVRGVLAGPVLGAGIGALAAKSLAATGGLEAGALGGALAALAAACGSGALDRIAAESGLRGSPRIVSQVLPVALASVGALIATAVFR